MKITNFKGVQDINVSRTKLIAFIELNLVCDMILESIHNINLPTKIKKDIEVTLAPFLDASMRLIINDKRFSNNESLMKISEVCSNYIKYQLNLDFKDNNLAISLYYLLIVLEENKMNSKDFILLNENRERIGIIAGAVTIKGLLKSKLLPFYQNQLDKIFKTSKITQGQFKTQLSRDIKTRIKIELNNQNIK